MKKISEKLVLDLDKGDEVLLGKWKNKKATVTGVGTDDKGQPVVKTTKGPTGMKFRISKLVPKAEDRSHPELNPKISAYEALLPYKDRDDIYISFTQVDKIGINPQSKYDTPLGIYTYPLKTIWKEYDIDKKKTIGKAVPFAGEHPYITIVQSNNVTNFDDISKQEYIQKATEALKYIHQPMAEHALAAYAQHTTPKELLQFKYATFFEPSAKGSDAKAAQVQNVAWLHHRLEGSQEWEWFISLFISKFPKKLADPDFISFKEFYEFYKQTPFPMPTTVSKPVSDTKLLLSYAKDLEENHRRLQRGANFGRALFFITHEVAGTPLAWNTLLRKLGYQAFVDYGHGIIHTSELLQAVFLSSSAFKVIGRILNKDYEIDDEVKFKNFEKMMTKFINSGQLDKIEKEFLKADTRGKSYIVSRLQTLASSQVQVPLVQQIAEFIYTRLAKIIKDNNIDVAHPLYTFYIGEYFKDAKEWVTQHNESTIRLTKRLFDEATIPQMRKFMSPIVKRTKAIRNGLLGQDRQIIRFISVTGSANAPILEFATEPTFGFNAPTIPSGKRAKRPKADNLYDVKVQLVGLPKALLYYQYDLALMTPVEMAHLLQVMQVRIDCSCMAFHWTGPRYQLSQINAALYPTKIADPIWSKRHKKIPTLCKHSKGVVNVIALFTRPILTALKEKYA